MMSTGCRLKWNLTRPATEGHTSAMCSSKSDTCDRREATFMVAPTATCDRKHRNSITTGKMGRKTTKHMGNMLNKRFNRKKCVWICMDEQMGVWKKPKLFKPWKIQLPKKEKIRVQKNFIICDFFCEFRGINDLWKTTVLCWFVVFSGTKQKNKQTIDRLTE